MSLTIKVLVLRGNSRRWDEDSRTLEGVVQSALRILNYSQTQFQFDLERGSIPLPPLAGERAGSPAELTKALERAPRTAQASNPLAHTWTELEELLTHEKTRLEANYIIGVLDEAIESDWFSRAIPGKNVIFITTRSWDYVSNLPVATFVAYEIIENLTELLIQKDGSEQAWLLNTVVHSNETRGCLWDMCAVKSHISFKMRTADICSDCLRVLKARLSPTIIQAIVEMLERTRAIALGRAEEPRSSSLVPLSWLVDQRYPFPIAYCFRAMRSELAYSRKWAFMYDTYKLVVRYLAFALLADRSRFARAGLAELDLSRLGFASDGQWGWVAFKLAEKLMQENEGSFFSEFVRSITPERLEASRAASKAFVQSRNEQQGHGWTGHEQVYQKLFERHFADLQTLLTFIKPLANYALLAPSGNVRPVASKWGWDAKLMMGSNPSFELVRQVTQEHPSDHCVLEDGGGGLLSLQPWILLSYCESCFREMVFLYNKLDHVFAEHTEYPTNHGRKSRELGDLVREQLDSVTGRTIF